MHLNNNEIIYHFAYFQYVFTILIIFSVLDIELWCTWSIIREIFMEFDFREAVLTDPGQTKLENVHPRSFPSLWVLVISTVSWLRGFAISPLFPALSLFSFWFFFSTCTCAIVRIYTGEESIMLAIIRLLRWKWGESAWAEWVSSPRLFSADSPLMYKQRLQCLSHMITTPGGCSLFTVLPMMDVHHSSHSSSWSFSITCLSQH